jgi:hypothetical protein
MTSEIAEVSLKIDDAWESATVASQQLDLENAERRHVDIEEVEVHWELSWTGSQLRITLQGNPKDRPFQAYIVVEEAVYSGETDPGDLGAPLNDANLRTVIHTPILSEVTN